MRLIFVRHGEPDYANDSLTDKGMREAELLADRLWKERLDYFYLSPQGRAQKTAEVLTCRLKKTGVTLQWLREFTVPVRLPQNNEEHLIWDFKPSFLCQYPQLYSETEWLNVEFIKNSMVPNAYRTVCENFDALLSRHGYNRNRNFYEVKQSNRDVLVFFCHFGIIGILLSHLMHVSPIALLQHFAAAPSSVTTLYTEEREAGIASFRCASYGDVSHLYGGGELPSFAGRFCETFEDPSERH